MRFAFLILYSLTITACANTPQLDVSRPAWVDDAVYPAFLAPDRLAQQTQQTVQAPLPDISARLARLRTKASRLRGAILTRSDVNRMQGRN
ncbi:MAG: hypothetical protein ACPG5U_10160 [Planktomarina sp.]